MNEPPPLLTRIELLRMIVPRLERLSVDSHWSHLASGCRGSMIKLLDSFDTHAASGALPDPALIDLLIDKGLELLTKAAREMGDPGLVNDLMGHAQNNSLAQYVIEAMRGIHGIHTDGMYADGIHTNSRQTSRA